MTIVYQLTPEQAEQLRGVQYVADMTFNPIQDANDNWVISQEEVSSTTIDWVKELPAIEYIPKESLPLL
jgi:predicted protein tyrosine phosphatase